jgi:anion-transporting  ArsA/GET3 family ATPase
VSIGRLLATTRVLLCAGSGGVGKTTTAAALAIEAAKRGRRTAVLTVDPAQRLKDALHLDALDGRPRAVPLGDGFATLDAMLLDVKGTFDDLVRTLARDGDVAESILGNRIYQNLSGALVGSAEYMAVETVYRLARDDRYDLLVVDTPPARHAVDFLDAPRRLLALLDSRAFAILKNPTSILPAAGSRLASLVLRGVLAGIERLTGVGLVGEIADFVGLIESLTDALRERVAAVAALLASDATAIVLVTAPEPRLAEETRDLAESLERLGLAIDGVIVNRALPRRFFGAPPPPPPPALPPDLQRRLLDVHGELRALAANQQALLAPIVARAGAPVLAEIPLLGTPPASLDDLQALARHLFADEPPGPPAAAPSSWPSS